MFEKKNLTRGLESVLKNLPVNDGKLRFTTDTARLFLDNDTTRIEITDFVKGLPEGQIRGIVTPLPKFYYAADTRRLLYYQNGEWLQVNHHVEFADKDGDGNNIKNTYAPLNSPSLSGIPKTPTPTSESESAMIVNKEYVDNLIKNSIGGVTQIDYTILSSLPETGEKGLIYFIYNDDPDNNNIFDEYIWINNKFELLGPVKMVLNTDFGDLDE